MIPDPTKMRPDDDELDGIDEAEPTLTHPARQRSGKSIADYNLALGIGLGIVLGVIIGALTGDHTMWILIGIAVGLLAGYQINQSRNSRS